MIFQLLYTSTATVPFWPDDLFALVEKSRRNNSARAITGMLLFNAGRFLQLLEGPEAAVQERFHIVEGDPRHAGITILSKELREEREFPGWTMGFERLDEAWNLPRAWSSILETPFDVESAFQNGAAAKELLFNFREAERI